MTTAANGVNGVNGHFQYDIPSESARIFKDGILNNKLIAKHLPEEAIEASKSVHFNGSSLPEVPVNWRFAESISALKALEATLVNVLIKRKYNVTPQSVSINTDHAQLFFMSPFLNVIDPKGKHITASHTNSDPEARALVEKHFPSCDKHRSGDGIHRMLATNIYPTGDGRYYHTHGSLNPDPTLQSLNFPPDVQWKSLADAKAGFRDALSKFTAEEYDTVANDQYRQAGTICYSTGEFRATPHGKANAHIGLFDIRPEPPRTTSTTTSTTSSSSSSPPKPGWWPDSPQTSAERPLAGLKVVDLTRIIAGPAIGRGLAELGASVMRITGPDVTDLGILHLDLNAGKWNAHLDLKEEADREKLRELVRDADVFLQGYRPHVLDKYGFGKEDVLRMVEGRDRGIVYAQENCYGWNGPWAGRSGWQQISDAVCGVSLEFGRAMGLEEPVTPVFPNSDFCTGVCGVAGILVAILRRAEEGGSFSVDLALNYYSQWLVESVGTYPEDVWEYVWAKHGKKVFRCDDNMSMVLLKSYMQMLLGNSKDVLFRPEFFEDVQQKNLGIEIRMAKPVLHYSGGEVKLGYNVGTRTNGVDQPRWPQDLMTEVVT